MICKMLILLIRITNLTETLGNVAVINFTSTTGRDGALTGLTTVICHPNKGWGRMKRIFRPGGDALYNGDPATSTLLTEKNSMTQSKAMLVRSLLGPP